MVEGKKKSSWEIPPPGPGTISGFFAAWVFVGAIIGLTLILMIIGKGPMALRVVGYEVGIDGKAPAGPELDKLVTAIKQANPMLLAVHGTSKELTEELRQRIEVKEENVASDGSSAIFSRYSVEKSEGARFVLIHFGETGKFGVVNVDLTKISGGNEKPGLEKAVGLAKEEFGKTPHAILVLAGGDTPHAPSDYLDALEVMVERGKLKAEDIAASDWRIFIPEGMEGNLKDCYVPTDNKAIKEFSDRVPIVAHFVFHKEDFE